MHNPLISRMEKDNHHLLSTILSNLKWLITQIHILDITLSLFALFVILSIKQIHSTKGGPVVWPILGFIPNLILYYKQLHNWNTTALSTSPFLTYRFSGRFTGHADGIVTADPSKIEHMLKTRFTNYPKGEFYRDNFRELLGDGIFNADGDRWKEQRRIATSEMHTSRFAEYSLCTMQRLVHTKLLKLIEKHVGEDAEIDLQEWLLRFTFDNVCVVALGVDPGCLNLDLPEIPFARAFEEATEYTTLRFLIPTILWKPMRFLNVGSERKLRRAVKVVHEFADKTVKNRKADVYYTTGVDVNEGGGKNDLLSRFILRTTHHKDIKKSSSVQEDKFLRDFCTSIILAGRDTSSVALVWFFWLIHQHPKVEKKIISEINQILQQRSNYDNFSEVMFEAKELDKMVYLQAALSESMRLYPPVPIDFKQVQDDDVYPDGTLANKGDRVYYHTYAMGRMESIWGKDSYEFKPERWMGDGEDGGEFAGMNPYKYVVFNAGPRLCVGKKFAYTQMKMVAASILLRYEVRVKSGQVIAPKITTTLYMKNGLLVSFHPRSWSDRTTKV